MSETDGGAGVSATMAASPSDLEGSAYQDGHRWGTRTFGHVRACPYPLAEHALRYAWLDGFFDARRCRR